jgi:alkanesulfonate monooxygenase SsuD/methylene tetrahydromethanopterin reductase-like flavin-dependent oxidoreductase (luciferase family)
MEFSLIFEAQTADPSRENERKLFFDCVDQAVYAEQMGFDRIWAVEHHSLKWYAHMSAPEIFLTWVAAKTTRIRIGHGVVCMPFGYNHPIRVAERVAMLDLLSNGRLDVGAGRGATEAEMSLCGVDPARTYQEMEEALRIIGSVWREDVFEWHGELLDISPHEIIPRPTQEPHPPLFLACTKADTVGLAAKWGVGALVLGFAGIDEIAHYKNLYQGAISRRTGDELVSIAPNDHFSALCPSVVLDDSAEALRIGARGQRFFAESIAHWHGRGPAPNLDTEHDDNIAAMKEEKRRLVVKLHEANIPVIPTTAASFELVDHAYGDAAHAIAYVQRLIDAGADEIMCVVQMGTVPNEVCMETIRQWGTSVIPHFRSATDSLAASAPEGLDTAVNQ